MAKLYETHSKNLHDHRSYSKPNPLMVSTSRTRPLRWRFFRLVALSMIFWNGMLDASASARLSWMIFFCGFATLQLELWESWEIMGKSIFFRFWVFKNSSTDHVQSLDLGIKFSRCLFHMCNRSERAPVRRIQRIGPGRDQVACSRFFLSESSPTRWCPSSESLSWCK